MKRIIAKIENWHKKCQEATKEIIIRIINIVKDIIRTKDDPKATDKERDYSFFICYVTVHYIAYILGYIFGFYCLGGEKRYYNRLKKKYNK